MEWMMDLLDADNQDLVFELLEFCTVASIQFIELMAQTGAHALSSGDSPAGPEMISPSMYRTYAFPYEKRVVDAAHRTGLPYILHICGDTRLILDSMTSLGVDGLDLDYKTDPRLAHDLLKDKVTFIGNIDPSGVLALGTVELVEQRTRELLEVFTDTTRFILNSGCAIPSNTPPRNIEAMIATARSF
jgi:uroporphyrinogen decarboxylase